MQIYEHFILSEKPYIIISGNRDTYISAQGTNEAFFSLDISNNDYFMQRHSHYAINNS